MISRFSYPRLISKETEQTVYFFAIQSVTYLLLELLQLICQSVKMGLDGRNVCVFVDDIGLHIISLVLR